jgi:hypothetical protein
LSFDFTNCLTVEDFRCSHLCARQQVTGDRLRRLARNTGWRPSLRMRRKVRRRSGSLAEPPFLRADSVDL